MADAVAVTVAVNALSALSRRDVRAGQRWGRTANLPLYTVAMRCFGTCWDFKDDPPLDEIEERINWLLAHGANEIGLLQADGGDTFCLLISDKRVVPRAIIEEIWDEWWRTRYSDEEEDRHRCLPEDVPLEWPQ